MSTQVKAPNISAAEKISCIANGYVAASALNAMVRMGVADLLAKGAMPVDKLAEQTGSHADSLCRVLRLLCSLGVFEETADGVFANNESSEFLRADVPNSQRDMMMFIGDPFHFRIYADMVPTIKDGRTGAEHLFGKNVFDVFAEDKEEQKLFDNAMTSFSLRAVPTILESYDFSGIETLVDVAGGHGVLLTSIMQKYPAIKGILFDLPHVVTGGEPRIKQLGLTDRCQMVSGDFFKSVPAGDAYIMKHIIHDWDDERSVVILKNCRKAMTEKGARKLLLVEMILSGRNESHPSKWLDIEMLMLPGGRERTERGFRELFEQSGFKLDRIVRTQSPYCVIEAVPV
jgi:hypothetical protein